MNARGSGLGTLLGPLLKQRATDGSESAKLRKYWLREGAANCFARAVD